MKKILLLITAIIYTYSFGQNNGNVGINTTDPKANLDVEGHVKIEPKGMPEYVFSPDENPSLLFRNKKTGILVAKKNSKSVYKLQYKIYTDEATRDPNRSQEAIENSIKIYSYNTKIPYNKYYLVQTHATFKIENPDGSIEIPGLPPIFSDENANFYPFKRIKLNEHTPNQGEESTWSIYADYPNTKIELKKEGQKAFWEITILAIDRKYITNIAESYKNY